MSFLNELRSAFGSQPKLTRPITQDSPGVLEIKSSNVKDDDPAWDQEPFITIENVESFRIENLGWVPVGGGVQVERCGLHVVTADGVEIVVRPPRGRTLTYASSSTEYWRRKKRESNG